MSHFSLICGLGNPGTRYAFTRHNAGFMVLDVLNLSVDPAAGWRKDGDALVSRAPLEGENLHLVKPQSFMNRSGAPLARVMNFYKVPIERLIVVHDDVDLMFGRIQVKAGGGTAGHNGLRSIVGVLGGEDFVRVRIGIGRPSAPAPGVETEVADWVLEPFSKDELRELPLILNRTVDVIRTLCAEGVVIAQNRFN